MHVQNTYLKRKLHIKRKSNGILHLINKKDDLYKTLIQTDTNNTVLYDSDSMRD